MSKRYYTEEVVIIAGIELIRKMLYIKNNGIYKANSGKYKYYKDGLLLTQLIDVELLCSTCKLKYKIKWLRIDKNESSLRQCAICYKRKKNLLYRPEWHNNESIKRRVEKAKITNMKKYGVTCTLNFDLFKKKKIKTWINKYGVDNPAKHPSIQEKIYNTIKNNPNHRWNNKNNYYHSLIFEKTIYWQSKNELNFIKWCESNNNIKQLSRGPMIRIRGASKGICVSVDFEVAYNNNSIRLVEIKGNHNGWRNDKASGRWHQERFIIEKYSNLHNYLRFYLILNNNLKVYERIVYGKD